LWILLLKDVLLMIGLKVPVGFLILNGSHALCLFSVIVKHLVGAFSRLVNDEWFHGSSINQPFWAFTLVTFIADIVVVTVVATIIFTFVWQIVTKGNITRSLKLLLTLSLLRLLWLRLRGSLLMQDWDIWYVLKRLVNLSFKLFVAELKVLHQAAEVIHCGGEISDEGLNVGRELCVMARRNLSLEGRTGTEILCPV